MSRWSKFREQLKQDAKKIGDKITDEAKRIATKLSDVAKDAEEYIGAKAEEAEKYFEDHTQKEFNSRFDKALKHKCEDLKIDAACQLLGLAESNNAETVSEGL